MAFSASGVNVQVALAGVRPEEIAEWGALPVEPVVARSMGEPFQAQARAGEQVVEQGKRIACRGEDAVILIDTLGFLHPPIARKILTNARNIADGGSLTIIATMEHPAGGETTVIALDRELAGARRHPAIDLRNSGTLRSELLVGEEGAEQIATAFAEVVD
jgi:transcription termination factor Rho